VQWAADGRPRRAVHSAAAPGATAVALLAAHAVDLFTGEQPASLRACHAPGCVLYFVKQHPRREWCSAGCGNRARVARHYRRHHPAAEAGA
jgi:predicted RNA-binding Zn ribbon-like protein